VPCRGKTFCGEFRLWSGNSGVTLARYLLRCYIYPSINSEYVAGETRLQGRKSRQNHKLIGYSGVCQPALLTPYFSLNAVAPSILIFSYSHQDFVELRTFSFPFDFFLTGWYTSLKFMTTPRNLISTSG